MLLATSRLLLRDFIEPDWPQVREYRSDPRYLRYYPEEASTEQSARDFVRKVMGWAAERPRLRFQLAITRGSDGVLLGNCGVRISSPEAGEAEFGCELDPREWGKGYASESSRAIIGYGFGILGMHRIWAHTLGENLAARKLAERMGMRQDAPLREKQFFKGRWWEDVVYAVLEQDWKGP